MPCSRGAFPTSRNPCGTLDRTLRRWDFMVNFAGVIQCVNSLKLRLRRRSQHFNNRMRCGINTSTHKLNPISTTSNSLFHSTNLHSRCNLRQRHSNPHHNHQCLRPQIHQHLRQLQPLNPGLPRPSILMKYFNRCSPQWNPVSKQWWKRLKPSLLRQQTSQLPHPYTLPAIIRQPYNINHLVNDFLDDPYDDPVLIIMDPPPGDLTNVPSLHVAAHDRDPGGQKDLHETAPTPGAIPTPLRFSTNRSREFHCSQARFTSTR